MWYNQQGPNDIFSGRKIINSSKCFVGTKHAIISGDYINTIKYTNKILCKIVFGT